MKIRPRVLIIDDEQDVQRTLRLILSKFCDVTITGSGWQGVEALQRQDYDIAIVDVRMPGMSGIETLKRIKEIRPDTEVLMLTGGNFSSPEFKEAIRLGAQDFVYKPIDRYELRRQIEDAMRHRRAAQQRRR